jgi:hypothetical protein
MLMIIRAAKRPRWRELPLWRRVLVIFVAVVGGLYILLFTMAMLASVAKF